MEYYNMSKVFVTGYIGDLALAWEHVRAISISVWEGAHVGGGRSLWQAWRNPAAFDFAPIPGFLLRIEFSKGLLIMLLCVNYLQLMIFK